MKEQKVGLVFTTLNQVKYLVLKIEHTQTTEVVYGFMIQAMLITDLFMEQHILHLSSL